MESKRILDLLAEYESRNITFVDPDGSWPIVLEKAKGVHVWDAEGRSYLDLTAAFGVAACGHANPKVVRAAQEQLAKLPNAMGDVHPAGNPHIHFDPGNIAKVGAALTARMTELDHANAAFYAARAADFVKRWDDASLRWRQRGAALKDVPVVVHHKAFSYLIAWLNMREVGSLEPLPGIPPSTAHLAELVDQMKRSPAKMVLYSSYDDPRAAQFLTQHTGIPSVMLPFTVGGTEKAKDLFGFFDDVLDRLLSAAKAAAK
jgi:zinc/manganese transport system substrate-binding protein